MARATMDQYRELLAERPKKFSVEQSEFKLQSPDDLRCSGCWHWAQIPNQHRSTCEVVAPEGEARMVPPEATCQFQTADGVTFPRQKAKSPPKPDNPKNRRTIG